ncbi:MAG TPA: BadF/BadG/BcrA/BcrD ATPase family protein [Symbiobacteriaceae bacterium]|nr:BadF/BadG/BcrA/BcrD ATPase family protein [Symbiobacteriaceae bacterium]
MERIVLGIDGGGTKTRCLAADGAGRILGEGLSGPSNYQVVGLEAAAGAVRAAAEAALAATGVALDEVAAVCAGLAGVGRPEDQAAMREALACFGQARLEVVPDARVALAGALAGQPGVVVISGTGSIAFGLDGHGQTHRAGGWGWILGDEGSGYQIGRQALVAALAAQDGTGSETSLTWRICEAWGLERLDQAIRRVYSDLPKAKADMAALAPTVLAAADAGDAVARAILVQAGSDLGNLAAAVLRKLQLPAGVPELVTIIGGVGNGSAVVREALRERLARLAPGARSIDCLEGPAEGAVRMACALL